MTSPDTHVQYWLDPSPRENRTGAALTESLEACIDELIASVPADPAPTLPRKSSLRRLSRLSIQDAAAYSLPSSPDGTFHTSPRSSTYKHHGDPHWRWSSHSSMGSSLIEAGSYSEPRTSTSSRTTWNVLSPEYESRRHSAIPLDLKRASTLLSDEEKQALRAKYPDDQADLEDTRSLSVYSQGDTVADLTVLPSLNDSRKLFINAKGISAFRLPLPSKELEIKVVDEEGHVVYVSSRSKRSSADASLSKPWYGEVVRTSYGKRTLMTFRNGEASKLPFTMVSSRLRRRRSFTFPGRGQFEWRYVPTWINGKRREHLVLIHKEFGPRTLEPAVFTPALEHSRRSYSSKRLSHTFSTFSTSKKQESSTGKLSLTSSGQMTSNDNEIVLEEAPRVLAQLVRMDKSSQASGKKQSTRAGVGGQLVLEPGCIDVLPEEVVVATALVMMKNEQDRLRTVQTAGLVTILL